MNPAPPTAIPTRFSSIAREHPNRPAIRAEGLQWSYAELDARSTNVALQVLDHGDTRDAPVALLLEHGAPMIAAVLGVLKAGGMYVGLDASHPVPHLQAQLADCGAWLLLADPTTQALAQAVAPPEARVQLLQVHSPTRNAAPGLPEVTGETGAWLTYTSGSTGDPKGVWRTHASVVHHADLYADLIGARPEDHFTLLTPLGLAASASPLFTALLHGACLCPFDVRSHGVDPLGEWLVNQDLSVCHLVPTLLRRLLRTLPAGRGLGPLRLVRLGGEAVIRSDVEALRKSTPGDCRLMHTLSSTETGLVAALMLEAESPVPEGRIPVGQVVEGTEVVLLDQHGAPVAPGSEGRLLIRSPALAEGYWKHPQETQSRFASDPTNRNRRQFVSADLGRLRPDGQLEHLGRLDQQVKIRGHRVDLAEVEAALSRMDGVRETAVALDTTTGSTASLVAWIATEPEISLTAQDCRRFLSGAIPAFMIPRRIVVRSPLPTTTSGKIDRRSLQQQLTASPAAERANTRPMPRDDIEKHIASIWEAVLGVEAIGRRENLFDLGADSLHVLEIVTRLSDALAVDLPISALVTHGTIESLAAQVARQSIRPSASPLIALRAESSAPPLFLVPGGHGHVATFGQLARQLSGRPIYAFQAPGLQGECWPWMSIPTIAGHYAREIRSLRPREPVQLAGLCVGGMIAFEMARQLVAQGGSVGLLALIETHHPDVRGRAAPLKKRLQYAVRDNFRILRWRLIRGAGLGRGPAWLPAYRRFIAHMYGRARRRYRPGFYGGPLSLVLAGDARPPASDDSRLWMSRHASETQTAALPHPVGDLFALPRVKDLAGVLQSWMNSPLASR